jgi:Domain of unknown function (DUF4188)
MNKPIQQRMTGTLDGDFVVFLIGMRVNRWWKVLQWLRVAMAMQHMLRELGKNPELGYLGGEGWFGRTTIMVQYWRSTDALVEYAKSRDAAHLPAWRAFNKLVGTNGDVGIWHETYSVGPGDYESIYVNMMPFGLGKAGRLTPGRQHAQERMAAGAERAQSPASSV